MKASTRSRKLAHLISRALVLVALSNQQAAQAKTQNWDEVLKNGNTLLAQGESERAAAFFATKIKKYPNSGACHTALGRAYKRLGKLDPAKQEFKISTEVEPDYADGFYELGVLQESDKEWSDAASAFEKYLALKPENSQRRTIEDRIRYCKGQQ